MTSDIVDSEQDNGEKLCDRCGSIMIIEDKKHICPHCDAQINFFGEDDEDNS
jgi:Zn finger protein HypA/HybF involved in hydrogenase expression